MTREFLSGFAKLAWLQYLDMEADHFGISLLEKPDELLEERLYSETSVVDEGQATLATGTGADNHEDDDDNWDLKRGVDFEKF